MGPVGNRAADAPQADDPQRLPAHLRAEHVGRTPAGPRPAPHVPFPFPRPARQHKEQREGEVRRVVGQHLRRVRHDEPARLRRRDVDVVVADPEVGEDPGAQRLRAQHLGRDPVGHGAEEPIRRAERLLERGPFERPVVAVAARIEEAREPLLHPLGQAPGDDDGGTRAHAPASRSRRLAPFTSARPFASTSSPGPPRRSCPAPRGWRRP